MLLFWMFISICNTIYFFTKKFIFPNVYISVNTIFECHYIFFDRERGHQLSTYSTGEQTVGCHASCVRVHLHHLFLYFWQCFCPIVSSFFLWKFNCIQKRCVREKRLFFSSKINFYCKLFFLKIILANEKSAKTLLILIK